MASYQYFIDNKNKQFQSVGFDVDKNELNSNMFDYQKDIVKFALKKGKSAIFADCGLGKTLMQLEFANQVHKRTGGKILILAPLCISKQTKEEGKKFGIDVQICETQDDVINGINITNYEKMDKFVAKEFTGIVLDESSILKSFTSKTRCKIIDNFAHLPYKLACTATPAPNDYMELGNHAEFLGVMSRSEMLSMYFIHDSGETSKWRLKGHADNIFWNWLASWCVVIKNPKDLGYELSGFNLPKLNTYQIIADDKEPISEVMTLTQRRKARKDSLEVRCQKAADIVNNSDETFIVWCDLNDESKTLHKMINNSVEVKGSDKNKHKSDSILGFADNKIKCLVTKPSIAGFGVNWQNCHNIIFVGLSDSYEQYYQAVRRCWRFGQNHEVNVYIVISSKEGTVKDNIDKKQKYADVMQDKMIRLTKEVTRKELCNTARLVTLYEPKQEIVLPKWEEFIA